jgi:hypothetical protein
MKTKDLVYRYDISEESAHNLLRRVEEKYQMDWSEMSWREIDARVALTAWRSSVGAPVSHVLSQDAYRLLKFFEKEYII